MCERIIVYASTCIIPAIRAETEIKQLVCAARRRNVEMGVTGVLLHSGRYFAQAIEGDRLALQALMKSIRRDPRHKDIIILQDAAISKRRFAQWSLGYSGSSAFVSSVIARSAKGAGGASGRGLGELMRLMEEFASSAQR